ncbi:TIGR01906 family membrane protein [Sporolactobacillus terrae]|uniref:Membrane protein n=1 Tax=Sporolactobacillus terrae TaxID=269673 RepID=A0A410DA05_9BACL|nr:TIGR01906 family membrane protein [Sporolactobacillus terrae]QAA22948.1 TIGR01906 family membrane protein [Sporolactobacillus terrae]QAA25921.1 TIGR01906 family membrane protein [Sporolactobacillus terrae]UAK17795.1 TIGR01906 family membrane protein [Sporolactobacillus terrae]BBN99346.1 membrane protein [Sporolactobacillus terrae]
MFFSTYRLGQLGLAVSIAIFIICFAVLVTLGFTPLYYFDVQHLDLVGQSGFSYDQIVENYNYTIQYLINPLPQTFHLPSFDYSRAGRIHFQDVKRIFMAIELLLVVSAIISVIGIFHKRKQRDFSFFKPTAIMLIMFTLLPLMMFAIDFDGTFILFHKLFFRNDYWVFNPQTDPIITILPEAFFLHAALLILFMIVAAVCAIVIIAKQLKKRSTSL